MEESKELTVNGKGNDLSLPSGIDATKYGVDMGEEDIIVPRLSLLQPTSKIEGAGKFYFTLTKELFDTIDMVVFSNQRGRVMFDPDMSKQETICGSSNRSEPSPRFDPPQAPTCVECKFSKRGYSEEVLVSGRTVNKYCSETNALRCMFVDTLFPFIFVGRRTSLQPINEFLSYMQYECVKNKRPLCCFPVRMTSKMVTKPNQKYYVPVLERRGMIEKEEFMVMMNKYATYDVEKTFEEEAKGGNDEDAPF